MRWKSLTKKLTLAALALFLGSSVASATDTQIFPSGPIFRLTGLVWGTSTPPGFNNNYFFVPSNQNENVCVSVLNQNTSNPHTYTITIVVNSNPANISPSDATWQIAAQATLTSGTAPSQPTGLGAQISGVALASINLSGSTTQAGSPETAIVTISQTQGNCFAGYGSIGAAPNTVSSVRQIQSVSEGLNSAFFSTSTTTNPTAGEAVLSIQNNSGPAPRSLYFDRAIFLSTVATTINISGSTSRGTCTVGGPINLQVTGPGAAASVGVNCTVAPTAVSAGTQITIALPANTSIFVDLTGYIVQSGTINGLTFYASAVTATLTTTAFWYEK